MIANDPRHLGGAIDADGADKAARFMQLCDALRAADGVARATRPASWSGPSRRRRPRCATPARMFVVGARRLVGAVPVR